MSVVHKSEVIPTFPDKWDPDDKEWVYFSWADLLGATSFTSTWVLPANWTNHSAVEDQTIQDLAGRDFEHTNGVLLSQSAGEGTYTITNRVTVSDGRIYDRSVKIVVAEQ